MYEQAKHTRPHFSHERIPERGAINEINIHHTLVELFGRP